MSKTRRKAMAIWAKRYGESERAMDFAGREMERDAYNNKGSKYGWNLDHVLPKSKGGKATEDNLVCCSMATNEEKAASFPCFSANGRFFRVHSVSGRREIVECITVPVAVTAVMGLCTPAAGPAGSTA